MKSLRLTEGELQEFYRRAEQRGMTREVVAKDAPTPRPRRPVGVSHLERRMAQQIEDAGLPEPRREYFPIIGREYRLDFAWADRKLYVEVQGQAHRIKGKFRADIEKRALLTLAGWRGLEVGGTEIRNGTAIEWLKQLWEVK